ncbi:nitrogen fixation protein [Myxococcota bacterium]|nr:nitrogen fixation protein [Myxococcota bacterium]
MKIGVTSHNFKKITAHPGRARHFFVFEEAEGGLVEQRLELPVSQTLHNSHSADHPVQAFDVLITGSCCQNFRARMGRLGVQVIATSEQDPRAAAEAVLAGRPLPEAPDHKHEDHDHHHH